MTYDELPLLPNLIAETVCSTPYTGRELSVPQNVAEIEEKRQKMTIEQIREFSDLCDKRCHIAYDNDSHWFMKCLKDDNGRDRLYMWISHWLVSYLINPEVLIRATNS